MIDIPVRVRDALKSGMYKKNYRVIVYDKNDNVLEVLDNNRLITESVKIDERMCSGKVIKFGLCEGTSLDFQYFDYDNISGKRIKLMLDIEYLDADGVKKWYELPMGYYNVDSCSRQFSTGIYKASCYNKLKSEYMDKDATELIKDVVAKGDAGSAGSATVGSILDSVLDGYAIEPKYEELTFRTDLVSTEPRNDIYNMRIVNSTSPNDHLWIPIIEGNIVNYDIKQDGYYRLHIPVIAILNYINSLLAPMPNYALESNPTGKLNGMLYDLVKATGIDRTAPIFYAQPWVTIKNANGAVLLDKCIIDLQSNLINGRFVTNYYTGLNTMSISIRLPFYLFWRNTTQDQTQNARNWDAYFYYISSEKQSEIAANFANMVNAFKLEKKITTNADNIRITSDKLGNVQNVTLRDLQSAVFEMNCQFGRLDRNTDLFSGLTLNNGRLVPSDTLYPSDDLYPQSNAERTDSSSYEKLWTDNVGVQRFRYLIITYKGIVDGQEKDIVLQRTVNPDGTTDYNMSSNWLFKNLVWTEEQVAEYADAMVELMRDVSWFPFEMWSAGLPYLEPGDEIEISNSEGTYTSYILQRQLSGIQMLKDTFINGELDIF